MIKSFHTCDKCKKDSAPRNIRERNGESLNGWISVFIESIADGKEEKTLHFCNECSVEIINSFKNITITKTSKNVRTKR